MVSLSIGVGAAGGGFTVTVVEAVFVPPSPMTVTVYCVVVSGHTCREPPSDTFPIAGSIDTVEAFVEVQLRSAHSPLSTEAGLAMRETVGAAIGGGGGGAVTFLGSGSGSLGQSLFAMAVASFACAIASFVRHSQYVL